MPKNIVTLSFTQKFVSVYANDLWGIFSCVHFTTIRVVKFVFVAQDAGVGGASIAVTVVSVCSQEATKGGETMVVAVFYDLETTDLRPEVDHEGVQIVSIGAVTSSRRARFERYLYPTCRIEPGATRIHGLVRDRNHGDLYSQNSGNYMDAVSMTEGLNGFMQFLYEVSQNGREMVVLVNYLLSHKYVNVSV